MYSARWCFTLTENNSKMLINFNRPKGHLCLISHFLFRFRLPFVKIDASEKSHYNISKNQICKRNLLSRK